MASKKFKDLSPQQQGIILAIFPLALALLVFYDFVKPLHAQVATRSAQLKVLQTRNLRDRMLERNRTALLERVARARQQLNQLRQIVPDQPADDEFVKTVDNAALASAVYLRSLVAEKPKPGPDFTSLPFTFRADGTYYRMLTFFIRLAGSPRIINVSSLWLLTAQATRGGYKLSPQETVAADCVLTTYYNAPGEAPRPKKPVRRRK